MTYSNQLLQLLFLQKILFVSHSLYYVSTCLGLYMVGVERQTQNRQKMMAEQLKAMDGGEEA